MQNLYHHLEKEVCNLEEFIKQQNESAKAMKDESNNLIEYYTVMKKAGKMILGESAVNRSSFDVKEMKSEVMESELANRKKQSPSGY